MFLKDYLMLMFSMLLLLIMILMSVAFLTLMERKILSYIQIRKGPNKVSLMGLMQPFSDALKLFTKEYLCLIKSNYLIYYFSPVFTLFLSMILWLCMPMYSYMLNFSFSILFFLCCSSLFVYSIMMAGWSSNSTYSLLGGLRSVAQTISYEVSLSLIIFSFLLLILSMNIYNFFKYQEFIWLIFFTMPLSMIWFVSSLAEMNRTPFDFAEGESELVSGFNVEYSSGGFALIFMAEYANILFMSMFFITMFLGGNYMSFLYFLKLVLISFMFIWVRGTLPRFRYDKLMYLAWKIFLPMSLNYILFYFGYQLFLFVMLI